MERDVLSQHIKYTYILQPSIIGGQRKEQRWGETLMWSVFKLIQVFFFGKLKKYKITEAHHIAQALINLVNSNSSQRRINSNSIKEIALNK